MKPLLGKKSKKSFIVHSKTAQIQTQHFLYISDLTKFRKSMRNRESHFLAFFHPKFTSCQKEHSNWLSLSPRLISAPTCANVNHRTTPTSEQHNVNKIIIILTVLKAQTTWNKNIFCLIVSDGKLTSQCMLSVNFTFTHVIALGNKELNLDCFVYKGQESPKMYSYQSTIVQFHYGL